MYNREKILKTMREIVDESKTVKPYVVIAQPRRNLDEVPAQHLDTDQHAHVDFSGYSRLFANIGGQLVDIARNYLMELALASGAKYLLFVGEDTVFPYDGFIKLHETAEKNPGAVVVGVYYVKISVPMIMVNKNDQIVPADVTPGQVFEAWQTGLDAALIPISALQKLKDEDPELPFCCIAGEREGLPHIGEDNFFVYRLRKNGIKLLVNTDVQCLHCDLESGKYTAHPSVNLDHYFTNFPMTELFTIDDKFTIDKRYVDRMPKPKESPE